LTSDLGVWTADERALVLIDYQNEMLTNDVRVAEAEKRAAAGRGAR
jgi:hypothetical protein